MFALVYVSTAARPFSSAELERLLRTSRENNARLGITGMLLYEGGTFIQQLEGEEAVVRGLFQTIRDDTRHRDVTLIHAGPAERRFSEWTMGYRDLNEGKAKHRADAPTGPRSRPLWLLEWVGQHLQSGR
jgi:hypothetical protein